MRNEFGSRFEELGFLEPEKSFDSGEDVSFILNSHMITTLKLMVHELVA